MELGSTVTLNIKGTTPDGMVFVETTPDNLMTFQTGMDMVIDGLEFEILGMEKGEKKTVVIDQYKAYGEYLEEYTTRVPLEQVPVSGLKPGKRVYMHSSDDGNPILATVIEVTRTDVVFDLNHPLAGMDLTYEIEIIDVEEPPENFVSAREKEEHMKENMKLLGGDQSPYDYR